MIVFAMLGAWFISGIFIVLFLRAANRDAGWPTSAELYQRDCNPNPNETVTIVTILPSFTVTHTHSPVTPWIGLTQAERDLWLDALGFHDTTSSTETT